MILSALLYWVLTAAILMLVDAITPGIHISGFGTALLAAFVMGLVNFFIRPVLMLLTLPLNLLTLGLFSFVINALLFALVAWLIPGFEVSNFLSALLGSLFMAIMTSVLSLVLGDRSRFA
ncbi:phage holin family protein [Vampirovibrio chlorellavorus]|uniref:phage holin family protein n=1 Tax=Vampirovibrio chlorellavorus TaxID=758823 RepID=UPI0026EAD781|nr:phage holin family protein [Vampirovibrio chlorellavorus]